MSRTFLTVQGNTAPVIQITCKRRTGPIDLTDCVVSLIIVNPKTNEVTNTGHQQCTIVTASSGIINYQIEATDFPNNRITYSAEVKIVYPSTRVERLYEKFSINPRPALG